MLKTNIAYDNFFPQKVHKNSIYFQQ